MTFDSASDILYCSDESYENGQNGSLTALAVVASDHRRHGDGGWLGSGSLSEIAKVETLPGGVASVVYYDGVEDDDLRHEDGDDDDDDDDGDDNKNKFIAIAH